MINSLPNAASDSWIGNWSDTVQRTIHSLAEITWKLVKPLLLIDGFGIRDSVNHGDPFKNPMVDNLIDVGGFSFEFCDKFPVTFSNPAPRKRNPENG